MLGKLIPELLACLNVLLVASPWAAGWLGMPGHEALVLICMVEFLSWMFMCTLIDIASRLRAPPPWWLGLLIAGGLLLLYPDMLGLLQMAWSMGVWMFAPIAWSLLERLRELWTLPRADRLEKLRRRALTFDRLYTGLVFAGAFTLQMLGSAIFSGTGSFDEQLGQMLLPYALALFFAIAAFDVWRVHRPAFERKPLSLWPRFDGGQVEYLDPL